MAFRQKQSPSNFLLDCFVLRPRNDEKDDFPKMSILPTPRPKVVGATCKSVFPSFLFCIVKNLFLHVCYFDKSI